MKITPPDPLSSEERALATLLTRVAPHGVPSPEIDASILSASHGAVAGTARSTRPRWPVAIGVAASMVLAVGVAWQLRPTQPEAADLGAASVQVLSSVEAPVASAPEAQGVAPSDPPNDAAGESAAAPPPRESTELPGPQPPVVSVPKRPPAAVLPAPVRAPPAPPAPPAPAYTASPPPAPPVGGVERKPSTSAGIQRLESARRTDPVTAREADSAADATTAARRELRVAPTSERVQEDAPAAANGATRARRTDLQVPVAADAQLQPGDWLERVRTRYGLGDEDAARRSLLLFVQDHPSEPVPDDLEPLLDE